VPSPFLPQLLQWTFFGDMGTVWNRQNLSNFGGFRPSWTPGIGVRVFSPLGPIQINAGYNPYPPYLGQALFTPPGSGSTLAAEGYNGVYCAIPEGAPVAEAPLSFLRPDNTGKLTWQQQSGASCPRTYQPPPAVRWINRLTFTFSIGSDF
jgi:hypothetical protein